MSDVENAISEKLDGVDLGSPEAKMLSAQLAKELGFEGNDSITEPTPEQKEMLDMLEPETVEAPTVEETVEPGQQYSYTTDAGVEKTFDSRESYLEYKIGADANKWSDKFKALEAKLETRVERETAPNQPVDPKTLLFDEAILKNEEWAPVVDQMTKAFEKYHALSIQDQDVRNKSLTDQIAKLEGQLGETSVRSEFGISRSDEAVILEQQPPNVREILTGMGPAERLAMIKQLSGKSEAVVQTPPPLPRAVSPQQAHVESSARGEPDRDPEAAFFEKFKSASESEQLGLLGQLYSADQSKTF